MICVGCNKYFEDSKIPNVCSDCFKKHIDPLLDNEENKQEFICSTCGLATKSPVLNIEVNFFDKSKSVYHNADEIEHRSCFSCMTLELLEIFIDSDIEHKHFSF